MTTLNTENKVEAEVVVGKETKENKVNKRYIVKKKDAKVLIQTIKHRNIDTCKAADVKLTKLADEKVNACKTQASCIDAMLRNATTFDAIVDKLVELKLCADKQHAIVRVKRHFKHDEQTRIIKRNVLLNA